MRTSKTCAFPASQFLGSSPTWQRTVSLTPHTQKPSRWAPLPPNAEVHVHWPHAPFSPYSREHSLLLEKGDPTIMLQGPFAADLTWLIIPVFSHIKQSASLDLSLHPANKQTCLSPKEWNQTKPVIACIFPGHLHRQTSGQLSIIVSIPPLTLTCRFTIIRLHFHHSLRWRLSLSSQTSRVLRPKDISHFQCQLTRPAHSYRWQQDAPRTLLASSAIPGLLFSLPFWLILL